MMVITKKKNTFWDGIGKSLNQNCNKILLELTFTKPINGLIKIESKVDQ